MDQVSPLPSVVDAVEFRREQYGLQCQQWAYVLGISPQHYSEFRRGKRELPKGAMANAFAYGVPAEVLFQAEPNKGAGDIERRLSELARAGQGKEASNG